MPTRIVGRKFRIGPVVDPEDPAEPAPLEDRHDPAEGREQRQDEPAGRDERDEERAEDDDHDEQRQADDQREVERQRVGQLLGDVDVAAGLAGHAELDAAVERRRGAEVLDQLLGGDARGPVGGDDLEGDRGPSVDVPIGATATTSSKAASCRPMRDLLGEDLVLRSGTREVGDDEQRAVDAGAELLGDGGVRVVLGRSGGLRRAVGQAEPHRHRGNGQQRRARRRRAGRWRSPAGSTSARTGFATAGAACDASAARSRPLRTRSPMSPSRAGVKVIAMSTAMATQTAPTVPITPRNGMPVTLSAEERDDDGRSRRRRRRCRRCPSRGRSTRAGRSPPSAGGGGG